MSALTREHFFEQINLAVANARMKQCADVSGLLAHDAVLRQQYLDETIAHANSLFEIEQLREQLAERDQTIQVMRDEAEDVAGQALWRMEEQDQQLAALTLAWTTEKPTVPGWYWWRRKKGNGVVLFSVVSEIVVLNGRLVVSECGDLNDLCGPRIEWAGPIEGPQ